MAVFARFAERLDFLVIPSRELGHLGAIVPKFGLNLTAFAGLLQTARL
ncbi:hypothetical protein CAMSH0001_2037 [Campylobacter showae RM3277]|uniref:Uncharacterized protein n=1 Tax=Campylobacter showae RM3277 TaxID=553219 RepID=C6REE5_9BACT|nr:hypothetical protein CAMSH0001_2037 [Campylobacter showae RM3277]